MASKCKHQELSVVWGDDSAWYRRENELHLNEETGKYEPFVTGEWTTQDGSWGDNGENWLIHINCERCDRVFFSQTDKVADDLTPEEEALVKTIRELGP